MPWNIARLCQFLVAMCFAALIMGLGLMFGFLWLNTAKDGASYMLAPGIAFAIASVATGCILAAHRVTGNTVGALIASATVFVAVVIAVLLARGIHGFDWASFWLGWLGLVILLVSAVMVLLAGIAVRALRPVNHAVANAAAPN